MYNTKVTMKRIPENRFRVKVNKCPLKKAIQTSWIDIHWHRCTGWRMLNIVVQNPAMTKNEWLMRVRVLSLKAICQ